MTFVSQRKQSICVSKFDPHRGQTGQNNNAIVSLNPFLVLTSHFIVRLFTHENKKHFPRPRLNRGLSVLSVSSSSLLTFHYLSRHMESNQPIRKFLNQSSPLRWCSDSPQNQNTPATHDENDTDNGTNIAGDIEPGQILSK